MASDESNKQGIIFAAGGIISRQTPEGIKILVIHRSRYNDWCLPKGKLNEGESFEHAALREVKEETGFDAAIKNFAGCVCYIVKEKPKVVLFWHIEVENKGTFEPSEEVKEIKWLKISNAIKILNYPKEKDLLMKLYKIQRRSLLSRVLIRIKKQIHLLQYRRLVGSLRTYKEELAYFAPIKKKDDKGWITTAYALLGEAESFLEQCELDQGWKCFHAAKRISVFGIDKKSNLELRASIIRQEAEKLRSWRKKAIYELLGSPESKKENIEKEHVYQAEFIRDEHYDNEYYKIQLLKDQFGLLVFILFFVIIGVFFYFHGKASSQLLLKGDVSAVTLVPGIILFGLLGGIVSAIISLRDSLGQSKIVELIANKAIIISRIFIGAASALFLYAFLKTGLLNKIIKTDSDITSPYVFFAISFIAGFTERLVLKAVEAVAGKEK